MMHLYSLSDNYGWFVDFSLPIRDLWIHTYIHALYIFTSAVMALKSHDTNRNEKIFAYQYGG